MQRLTCLIIALLVSTLLARPASAEDYIDPTELSVLQTLLRFGAIDINNDVAMDDYAKIAECDLYSTFHSDDFKWRKVREGLRSKIRDEALSYPANYTIKGTINLDRYDFNTKTFKIAADAPIMGVNALHLIDYGDQYCGTRLKILPANYTAALDNRVNIPGFVMSESDAQALLQRLTESKNIKREIIAKFNIRIALYAQGGVV